MMMNGRKWTILILALGLMGGGAAVLKRLQGAQRLGAPGVKTSPIAGSPRLQVDLPESVLDYASEALEPDKLTLDTLPPDTSFGTRRYTAPDRFWTQIGVVLMGADRTSIHKTEFCMEGSGWRIDRSASGPTTVRMDRPQPYDLPVMKYFTTHDATAQSPPVRGIYVTWYVASPDELTANNNQRMWWIARDLFRTGVLPRWALVSYFAVCAPGQEEATFERMKKLIAASVPGFQLVPRREATAASLRP